MRSLAFNIFIRNKHFEFQKLKIENENFTIKILIKSDNQSFVFGINTKNDQNLQRQQLSSNG